MPKPPTRAEAVADALAHQIESGQLSPGAWLPPERELAQVHDVVRSTIRRGVDILVTRGALVRHDGTGVRVRSKPGTRDAFDITHQDGHWRGFHVSMNRQGEQPYTKTTIAEDVPADPVLARWLCVPAGTPLLQRARLQGVQGVPPKQLSTTWFPPRIYQLLPVLRQVDTGPGGMHSRMEEIGLRLHFEDTVTCRRASADEAERLELKAGDPVMSIWRRCYDQEDHVTEATFRIIPGDRLEQVYRYQYRIT